MLTVTLTDNNNNVVISQKEKFLYQSSAGSLSLLGHDQPVEGDNSAEVQHALGLQYWNRQDQARAVKYLEAAYRLNPKEPAYALDYCRLLLAPGNIRK